MTGSREKITYKMIKRTGDFFFGRPVLTERTRRATICTGVHPLSLLRGKAAVKTIREMMEMERFGFPWTAQGTETEMGVGEEIPFWKRGVCYAVVAAHRWPVNDGQMGIQLYENPKFLWKPLEWEEVRGGKGKEGDSMDEGAFEEEFDLFEDVDSDETRSLLSQEERLGAY
jgi:hypothetical protein